MALIRLSISELTTNEDDDQKFPLRHNDDHGSETYQARQNLEQQHSLTVNEVPDDGDPERLGSEEYHD